jgi:magnesium-transporting ATPase (P-type)
MWLPFDTSIRVRGNGLEPVGDFRLLEAGEDAAAAASSSSSSTVVGPTLLKALPALEAVLTVAGLCNASSLTEQDGQWVGVGDATEIALTVLSRKAGLGEKAALARSLGWEFVTELPFDSKVKRMSAMYRDGKGLHVLTKGAFESVFARCSHLRLADGKIVKLGADSEYSLARFQAKVDALAAKGLRVLAFASKVMSAAEEKEVGVEAVDTSAEDRDKWENGLTFLGLCGLMDPPRPEVSGVISD